MLTDNVVTWETRLSTVDRVYPKTQIFAGDLEDFKSSSGGVLCIFGSQTFVLVTIGWMCMKQTSLSHSCTESKIISLDAGLRTDGTPAFDLWDVVIEVLHSAKNTHQAVKDHCRKEGRRSSATNRAPGEIRSTNPKTKLKRSGNRDVDELSNVDHVVTKRKFFSIWSSVVYFFEDDEAVIKMIIKSYDETRDGLFDRVNMLTQRTNLLTC